MFSFQFKVYNIQHRPILVLFASWILVLFALPHALGLLYKARCVLNSFHTFSRGFMAMLLCACYRSVALRIPLCLWSVLEALICDIHRNQGCTFSTEMCTSCLAVHLFGWRWQRNVDTRMHAELEPPLWDLHCGLAILINGQRLSKFVLHQSVGSSSVFLYSIFCRLQCQDLPLS